MNRSKTFPTRLRAWRAAHGLDQKAASKLLLIGRSYLSALENGREPGANVAARLSVLESETSEQLRARLDTSAHLSTSASYSDLPEVEAPHIAEEGEAESYGGARSKLLKALKAHGMTVRELGRKIGYDPGALEYVVEGRGRLKEKDAKRIVQILPELTLEDLLGGGDHARVVSESGTQGTFGAEPDIKLPPGMKGRMIPLLSMAQAGAFDASHSDDYYDYEGILALNVDDRRAFAIRVSGNSMEPKVLEGDVIICAPSKQPWEGCIAVVRTKSDQAFIKFWHQKGDEVELKSANAAYRAIHLPLEEIAGAWPVVQRITSDVVQK